MKQGIVYLVGAGPGDYGLISLKAIECIREADTIVYDRLADDRLLDHARPDVELVYVGKAASAHTMRQEDINQLLVDKALANKVVVRLKGGDPFVFGRGGEEALKLLEHGIPFEVVPGITSAIAVPAYAGIPVTHRGIATSFAVITGHEDPAKAESTIQWDKLATAVDTLVFLMGVENLSHITGKLLENGRPGDTPAAVIRWGTKPEQEVLVTTVARAAQAARGLKPPAIFIVGQVVALRKQLAWFDNRLLFGKKVLVTRAREQASVLTDGLARLGADCIEAPAIKIVPPASYEELDKAITRLDDYQWLIFTSVNGVEHFFSRMRAAGLDTRAIAAKVAAIGSPTAARLKNYGIVADIIPAEFRAEGVAEALEPHLQPGMKVLIPRALVARDVLPEKLAALGADVKVVPAYRTVAADTNGRELAEKLAQGTIELVTFTSSSTVTNLLQLLGENGARLIAKAKVACIGPITAETCLAHGIQPDVIAEEYTIKGLIEAITALYKGE
ncbi:uroporphyrinogen-III C-methyltransferase [Sporomusa acidovorans]|uniref:uroporphyrinogen-III C-methyltransferase n=1 Tax=Sporomusa acidovorans (strain ATCC 49682 / DSM 3132 / Mol) TaxID=1123286 RepID=A0ABZ3J9H1_SPOA4|nr:uroporphyrinogen-III C-methyltransferase [Sporomusa acidovorans]OZC22923.1 uroporphyrinogen-III C-methyltransferase [Sporomusa acidovorans DSM 3132]SDE95016.1 uroporphyrinogen III methyltransferase / synthase [Sporomusa acidovorans]